MDKSVQGLVSGKLCVCHLCWNEFPFDGIVFHHISYDPEATIPLCEECHVHIHNNDEVRPELTPDMTRSEAEARGVLKDGDGNLAVERDNNIEVSIQCDICGGGLVVDNDLEWFCGACDG